MNYGRNGIQRQKETLNARGPKWSRKFLLLLLEAFFVLLIGGSIVGAALGLGVFKGVLASAPDITNITVTPSGRSSFVYDSDGKQISKLVSANANRIPVASEQICDNVKNACVAIEDQRFYEHNGIDIQGIFRAGFSAFKNKSLGQGASTITQQLLKNNVFTDWTEENSNIEKIKRKIQEQYLAIQLEKVMTKDEILTNYLNTINLGQSTLGIQAASLRYFNKNASDLSISEAATIVGITKNPSKYNPISRPEDNKKRQIDVLDKMLELGYITQTEYNVAVADDVYSRINEVNEEKTAVSNTVNSYFVDALIDDVTKDLKELGYNDNQVYALMYSGGIKIYSTCNSEIQKIIDEEIANEDNYNSLKYLLDYRLTIRKADGSFQNFSAEMFKSYWKQYDANFNMLYSSEEDAYEAIVAYQTAMLEEGDEVYAEYTNIAEQPQISFVLMENETGKVLGMSGGRGEKAASRTFNRATQSNRQPGSCFKVLAAFAPAIDACGKTLASVYNDAPFNYYDGTPVSNWYGHDSYRGLQNIRYGIIQSLNVVAVKTMTEITPQLGYEYLLNFGFTTIAESKVVGDQIYTDIGQPLCLGGLTDGVTNYELCAGYAAIANSGMYNEPILYTRIEDADGNVLIDKLQNQTKRQVLKESTAFLVTSAMQDCTRIGTGQAARFPGMSIASKTGTTSDQKDVWLAAYTPYYTGTVWVGYDNNAVMKDAETKATKVVWKAIMTRIHEDLPDIGFRVPEGIVRCDVCSKSGLLPTAYCGDNVYSEYFTEETVPTETCNVHYVGRICAIDHLPATPECLFAYEGVGEFLPPEHESLWQGSLALDQIDDSAALDPLATGGNNEPRGYTGHCQHTQEWFSVHYGDDLFYQHQNQYYQTVGGWYEQYQNPEPQVPENNQDTPSEE